MEGIPKRMGAAPSNIDKFVTEQNVARYRKLLGESKDEEQRLTIAKLLADELEHLRKT
jgi:hypothetical protein